MNDRELRQVQIHLERIREERAVLQKRGTELEAKRRELEDEMAEDMERLEEEVHEHERIQHELEAKLKELENTSGIQPGVDTPPGA